MTKQFLIAVFISLAACGMIACGNSTETKTTPPPATDVLPPTLIFDNLAGTWKMAGRESFERWTKNDDGNYRSVAFTVKGKDTLIQEQVSVYLQNDKWIFETLVSGQNAGQSVLFTSTAVTATDAEFSNPTHDFPSLIHYKVTGDTLNAFIAGRNEKGGIDTIPFYYARVK